MKKLCLTFILIAGTFLASCTRAPQDLRYKITVSSNKSPTLFIYADDIKISQDQKEIVVIGTGYLSEEENCPFPFKFQDRTVFLSSRENIRVRDGWLN